METGIVLFAVLLFLIGIVMQVRRSVEPEQGWGIVLMFVFVILPLVAFWYWTATTCGHIFRGGCAP
jgi:hypothetical protein